MGTCAGPGASAGAQRTCEKKSEEEETATSAHFTATHEVCDRSQAPLISGAHSTACPCARHAVRALDVAVQTPT